MFKKKSKSKSKEIYEVAEEISNVIFGSELTTIEAFGMLEAIKLSLHRNLCDTLDAKAIAKLLKD